MLLINNLTIRIGGRILIKEASVQLPKKKRIGLIGRNGVGKSTLLKAIIGDMPIEAGTIEYSPKLRIGSVSQTAPDGTQTPLQLVLASNVERTNLLLELDQISDGVRIATIYERLNDIKAHSAKAKAAQILSGLGFDAKSQSKPLQTFSGGWRMRAALAASIFKEPDYLLLDEPTNHLDLESSIWLESFLAQYPNGMLLVSHDQNLLDRVANGILNLENMCLTYYSGNFKRFKQTQQEKLTNQNKMERRQNIEQIKIRAFVERFKYKASKARQAQSRLKLLARMQTTNILKTESITRFEFPKPEKLPPPIFFAKNAAAGYKNGPAILTKLNFNLCMGDRIALIGANGNGKTTLLRLLADELMPIAGSIWSSPKLRVGYFAQNQFDLMKPNDTAFKHLSAIMTCTNEIGIRAHLGQFGLTQTRGNTFIEGLSGGEKARLVLATITAKKPHLLLLDEPTNHLDIDAREALVESLNEFQGAVVITSHDPHLISLVADKLWLLKNGRCSDFDGDIAGYREQILNTNNQSSDIVKEIHQFPANSKRMKRKRGAEIRAANALLRQNANKAERKIAILTKDLGKLLNLLNNPEIYNDPSIKFSKLLIQKNKLEKDLKTAELDWIEAQEALEHSQ